MFNVESIKEKFKQVISYSQHIENPKVDILFDKWLIAKKKFIDEMDGKLIYEFPKKVSFLLDQKERNSRLDDFISKIEKRWKNYDLASFISATKEGFFDNIVPFDYSYDENTKINKGMKLIKAFKFFEKDKCILTDIQNYASRLIQENKIEGTLCLSVHPLDYLSLSENTHNWRSCHALDGDYRTGNLSYMIDSSTIICYLKSDKDEILPNFPIEWNSKKWRVLLFFSDDWNMLMAGRQYPFNISTSLNFITSELLPLSGICGEDSWTNWHNELLTSIPFKYGERDNELSLTESYVPIGYSLMSLENLIIDGKNSKHFNDLLHSSCYKPIYTYRIPKAYLWYNPPLGASSLETTKFHIGCEVPCLCCEEHSVVFNETMRCDTCHNNELENEDYVECDCCGRTFFREDAFYVQNEIICERCYDEETTTCEICGETFFNSEISFNRELSMYICSYCENNNNEER